ncbi:glycosyl transferase family 90 domain-containing protein [Sarocladium implicatum]|nr:glycosyl transferase family 90 domain-containing protein [Sarocladium implicatum]
MYKLLSSESGSSLILWPAASLICAVLTQLLSAPDAELSSEILCWTLLPFLFNGRADTFAAALKEKDRLFKRGSVSSNDASLASSRALLFIAAGVGAAALAASELSSETFLPALTPLILFAERRLNGDGQHPAPQETSSPLIALTQSPIATSVVALFSVITISEGDFISSLFSLPVVLALLAVYVPLSLWSSFKGSPHNPLPSLQDCIVPLSLRAIAVSTAIVAARWSVSERPWPSPIAVLALGVAKSCLWYSLIMTTRNTHWIVAPVVKVFAITATVDQRSLAFEHQALSYIVSSFLSLGQLVGLQSLTHRSRHSLWFFALLPLIPYLGNLWAISTNESSLPTWDSEHPHPIEVLIDEAQARFQAMQKRQSATYAGAAGEYRRRHGIAPPRGFEEWYEYAVSNDSPIIDDFDSIHEAIAPFLQLSGKDVTEMMNQIHREKKSELWMCGFASRKAEAVCRHNRRKVGKDRDFGILFNELLGDVGGELKHIRALVNHLDEPRVLYEPTAEPDTDYNLRDVRKKSSWDDLTRRCSGDVEDWNAKNPQVDLYELPFVANRSAVMDLCQHDEYRDMHGLLVNPKNLRLIEGYVPVLSTGKFSTMGDILIPSPAYIQSEFFYNNKGDVPWEKKWNKLYWDGSSTGGFAKDRDQWLRFHRQRFVSFVEQLETHAYSYLQNVGGRVMRTTSSFLNGRLYDVAFTHIFQGTTLACREEQQFFRTRSWRRADAALHSRLVFDLDGNGISGRFYRLLASHSLPLKQTLLREWHDERLIPWVHFVPISQGMEELPEVVRWLTSTERGQAKAKEMADAGRRWYSQALRDVDKGIYLYRVMLELGRIQDPERRAGET